MIANFFAFGTSLFALLAGVMFLSNAHRAIQPDDQRKQFLRSLKGLLLLILAVVYVFLATGIITPPNEHIILLVRADLFILFASIFAYGLLERA